MIRPLSPAITASMAATIEGWMPSVGSSSSSSAGPRGQRPGDGELLLLAAREVAARAVPEVAQRREQGDRLVHRVGRAPARGPGPRPAGSRRRSDPERSRAPAARRRGLPGRAGRTDRRVRSVAVEGDPAAARRDQAGEAAQQRGLAGAVAAEHGEAARPARPRSRPRAAPARCRNAGRAPRRRGARVRRCGHRPRNTSITRASPRAPGMLPS